MESCVEVLIQDDDVLEQTESFDVHLERTSGLNDNIVVSTRESVVNILNDDCEWDLYTGMNEQVKYVVHCHFFHLQLLELGLT